VEHPGGRFRTADLLVVRRCEAVAPELRALAG
jgi:hypothetical protein